MVRTTIRKVAIIQSTNCRSPSRANSWSRECAGSAMAPNVAIRTAPPHTNIVPTREYLVNASCRINVASKELNTNPEACSVESTGSGRVVICIEEPTMLLMMNRSMPICHRRRR